MSSFDDVTRLTGRSGEAYTFFIAHYSSTFLARPGVYVMAKAIGGDRYQFCYVGHTADMSVRPFAPDKVNCFRQFGVDRIFHLEEFDAAKRANIANDLIQAFGPSCNTP